MRTLATLDLTDADRAIGAMRAECERRGQAGVLVVADNVGDPIVVIRMDGSFVASVKIAMNKAYTAARERKPSAEIGRKVRDPEKGFDIAYFGDDRMLGWGGGLPVIVDGACVGAVAVSGLPESDDIEIATLGVGAIVGK